MDQMDGREAPPAPPAEVAAHVMLVPWPSQGHLNPMMHLARMLSQRGVAVSFANTQINHQRLLDAKIHTKISGEPSSINFVSFDDGLTYADYLANDIPKQSKALDDAVPELVQLGRDLRPRVTHVVGDLFVPSTSAVAQQLGVPHVCFWTQSAASYAIHVHFGLNYAKLKEYFARVESDDQGRCIDFIPGCPPLHINDISTFLRVCDPSDFIFSKIIRAFITMAPSHSRIIFNTFHNLEPEALNFVTSSIPGTNPDQFITIGPILPSSFLSNQQQATSEIENRETSLWAEDHSCIQWLDKQKPESVLYVSFGSIAILSREQIAEFAAGLESSGFLVLMVVRPDLMYGQEAVFPKSFSQGMSGGHNLGMCVAWAPQLQVLAHPAVGGFLTHAGWNSTLEGVSKGVPMLCWPYFSDQMLNTRFVVDVWKTGLDFELDSSSGLILWSEIQDKVKHLMDPQTSKALRENAFQLQQLVVEAYYHQSQTNVDIFSQFLFE